MKHHRRGLRRELNDDALLQIIERGESASLDDRRQALLRYVEKLTLSPATMESDDVDALRAVGFADEDVLAIVEVTGYYAYVNRMADGLGVTVEEWFRDS
jgi:uncharacterized peroxidase-related enzyme